MLNGFRTALCFFTTLPVGWPAQVTSHAGVVAWFPAVGLVLGTVLGSVLWLLSMALPPLVCGALVCLAWAGLTGGLHLDGVSDCGDGMLVEAPREKRLVIMKDSRLGTFGGLALFAVCVTKFAALATLAEHVQPTSLGLLQSIGLCSLAAILGRCSTFLAMQLPSARPGGMGSTTVQGVRPWQGWVALVCALSISWLHSWMGLAALSFALFVVILVLAAAKKRLGGVTGDVYGCLIEVTECAVLLICCLRPFLGQ